VVVGGLLGAMIVKLVNSGHNKGDNQINPKSNIEILNKFQHRIAKKKKRQLWIPIEHPLPSPLSRRTSGTYGHQGRGD